jgi:predicted small secreted protein
MRRLLALGLLAASAFVHACSNGSSPADASADSAVVDGSADGGVDSLVTSFVVTGCNRIEGRDWDAGANPSSANVPQLQQTFADIAAITPRPKQFFFTGDLVLNERSGTKELVGQLDGWSALYAQGPLAGAIDLVPLPGNHELLALVKTEVSNPPADGAWTAWLARNHFDRHAGNGPTNAAPNPDALADDQSALSFSFEADGQHYIVLNTDTWTTTPDPATGSTQVGWIALAWLKADLAAAEASPSVRNVFVFGHKPLVSPGKSTSGEAAINPALVAEAEAALDASAKTRAYFCAHAHQWDLRRLPGTRGVWQVVAGNGGSTLDSSWKASPRYFGFTEIKVYESGRIGLVSHERPVPSPYNGPTVPATAGTERPLTP